jgi:phage-related tail fiber protein
MTFSTKHRTGFEIGTFSITDTGSVGVAAPTSNNNPSTKLYTDNKVDTAVSLLSTVTTTLTGDISGSGINSIVTVLSLTGVTSGTYNSVTVDNKGRILSGGNLTFTQGTVRGSVSGTVVTLNLQANGVSPGIYQSVSVDSTGRIISGGALTSSNVTTALGFSPVNKAGDTLAGHLNLSLAPTNNNHLTNKRYSDKQFYIAVALGY